MTRDKERKDAEGRDDALEVAAGEASQVIVFSGEADVFEIGKVGVNLGCDPRKASETVRLRGM